MKKVIQAWALGLVNWPNDHLRTVCPGASLIAETSVPGASHHLPPVGCSFWKEPVAWVVCGRTSQKKAFSKAGKHRTVPRKQRMSWRTLGTKENQKLCLCVSVQHIHGHALVSACVDRVCKLKLPNVQYSQNNSEESKKLFSVVRLQFPNDRCPHVNNSKWNFGGKWRQYLGTYFQPPVDYRHFPLPQVSGDLFQKLNCLDWLSLTIVFC